MGTKFTIDEQAERATTGLQAFTDDLEAADGEAFICLTSRATALNTITAQAEISWAVGRGSASELGCTSSNEDAVGTTNTQYQQNVSHVWRHHTIGTLTQEDSAAMDSRQTNGMQVDWLVASGTQYRSIAGMFGPGGAGGNVLDVDIERIDEATTAQDATFAVTGIGFKPQAAIFFYGGANTSHSDFRCGVGVAVDNGAGTDQKTLVILSDNGQAATSNDAQFRSGRCVDNINAGAAFNSWELTSWDTDGVTITVREAGGASKRVMTLFLRANDWNFVCGQYTIPTSGNITVSSLGINPEFMLDVMSLIQSADTFKVGTAEASAIAITLNSLTEEFGVSVGSTEGAGTTVAKSLTYSAKAAMLGDDPTAIDVEGTTALGTDQWVRTMTNWPATATLGLYIAGGRVPGKAGITTNHVKRMQGN